MKTYQLSENAKQLIINKSNSKLILDFELKNMNDQDFFLAVMDSLIIVKH